MWENTESPLMMSGLSADFETILSLNFVDKIVVSHCPGQESNLHEIAPTRS